LRLRSNNKNQDSITYDGILKQVQNDDFYKIFKNMKNNKPYYAVIFTSTHSENTEGYTDMANQMETLAKAQEGFLGIEGARDAIGITVSYWESLDAIKNWKQQSDHLVAQQKGRQNWYNWYKVRICKVEREYEFFKD